MQNYRLGQCQVLLRWLRWMLGYADSLYDCSLLRYDTASLYYHSKQCPIPEDRDLHAVVTIPTPTHETCRTKQWLWILRIWDVNYFWVICLEFTFIFKHVWPGCFIKYFGDNAVSPSAHSGLTRNVPATVLLRTESC